MQAAELRGDKVTLRILDQMHIDDYCAILSPAVCAALHVTSITSEQEYLFNRLCADEESFFYTIFDSHADKLIGGIEIRPPTSSRGQLYSWIHENYWGLGCFREALGLITREYFAYHKDVPCVTAHVDVSNKRSYWALKKSGFADIGICQGPYGKQYRLAMRRR